MKRIFYTFILLILTSLSIYAQDLTLWYGVGYCGNWKQSTEHSTWKIPGPRIRLANFGLDYSIPIARKVEWTMGLGYNTKHTFRRINYIQAETNIGYRLVDSPESVGLSVFAGPYVAYKVKDDGGSRYYSGPIPKISSPIAGLQAGIKMDYKKMSFKIGFEGGLSHVYKNTIPNPVPYGFFMRAGFKL